VSLLAEGRGTDPPTGSPRPAGAVGAALGLQLGLPTLAATNVAIGVVAGAALLRESVGLGRMLHLGRARVEGA
jgi:hypothetical protein